MQPKMKNEEDKKGNLCKYSVWSGACQGILFKDWGNEEYLETMAEPWALVHTEACRVLLPYGEQGVL